MWQQIVEIVQLNIEKSWKIIKNKIDSEPVYGDNDKYIKAKIKMYGGSVNTNFQGKGLPKKKAPCKCLSIIMLDSVVKAKKRHYPQTPLEDRTGEPCWWWFRKKFIW